MRRTAICAGIGFVGFWMPAWAADLSAEVDGLVAPPPSWQTSFSVDVVYATRSDSSGVYAEDAVSGDPLVSGDDLGFGWAPGVDARLNINRENRGLQFRFLGAFNFDASDTTTTTASWTIPTEPPLFGLGAADVVSEYDSSLNSLEFNVSRPMGDGNVFLGLRGLLLNEEFLSDAAFLGNDATVSLDADTAGIGPQIGGEMRFGGPVFVDIDGRIGALLTKSDLDFSVVQTIGENFSGSGEPWDWAAVAEAGIAAGVMITPTASLRVGYRIIYVHNMPTAISSIEAVDPVAETIGHSGDNFFAHGVTFGFEGRF